MELNDEENSWQETNAEDIFNDCSVDSVSLSSQRKRSLKMGKPDVVAQTTPLHAQEKVFWKIDDGNQNTSIHPLRNWVPSATCRALCRCYPAQALQVYDLQISCSDKRLYESADILGFFAVRDFYDKRQIKIFDQMTKPTKINFAGGAGYVNLTPPSRGILYSDLVFEYDLLLKGSHGGGGPQNTLDRRIQGAVLYKVGENTLPYSSPGKIVYAEIPVDLLTKMTLKFVRFAQAIEAVVTIKPPIGLEFCLTASMADITDEIQLFSGKYVATQDQNKKFVLVVPFDDILELKFIDLAKEGNTTKLYAYNSFFHGRNLEKVKLPSGIEIDMEIKWSRM